MKSPIQRETEQIRRCLLVVLFEAGKAIRAKTARNIMDDLNSATTWDDFIAQIEYLAGEELIRVFPATAKAELSAVEQAQYLSICRRSDWESPEADKIMLRIRQRGRHFLEGNAQDVLGVATA